MFVSVSVSDGRLLKSKTCTDLMSLKSVEKVAIRSIIDEDAISDPCHELRPICALNRS